MMGWLDETLHPVVANGPAILLPIRSIRLGLDTSGSAVIKAMAGDNVDYTDVDPVAIGDLR